MAIQLIDRAHTLGYQVRVGPRSETSTKFFAIRKHGGPRQALAAARVAEAKLQRLAPPPTSRVGPRTKTAANNKSGLVGIRPRQVLFAEQPYLYFVASWSKQGKAHSTSYSAEKHGLLEALRLAMQAREKATGQRHELTPRKAWGQMKHLVAAAAG